MKKQLNIKKLILLNLPYILMGLFAPPTSVKRGGWPWVRTLRQKCFSFFSTLPVALAQLVAQPAPAGPAGGAVLRWLACGWRCI